MNSPDLTDKPRAAHDTPVATEDGASPAAALNAGLVRRGHNPWRGKDQTPAAAAEGSAAKTPAETPPARPASPTNRGTRARELLDRVEPGAPRPEPEPPSTAATLRARLRPNADGGTDRRIRDDDGPTLLDRLPEGVLKDAAIFAAVFIVSCALMLYLSLRAF